MYNRIYAHMGMYRSESPVFGTVCAFRVRGPGVTEGLKMLLYSTRRVGRFDTAGATRPAAGGGKCLFMSSKLRREFGPAVRRPALRSRIISAKKSSSESVFPSAPAKPLLPYLG